MRISADDLMGHTYEMMKWPVTNAEYVTYLRSLSVEEAAAHYCRLMEEHFFGGILKDYSCKPGFEKKPVVFVSWHDAVAYAQRAGARLPTGDEWRRAAAWLPQEERLARYCTGSDEMPTQNEAIFYDRENGWALPCPHLADVDWYKPSGAYGLCGMAGNVSEWVDETRPNGWKSALGGSLFRPVEQMLTAASEGDHPTKRLSTFGFRLARDVTP